MAPPAWRRGLEELHERVERVDPSAVALVAARCHSRDDRRVLGAFPDHGAHLYQRAAGAREDHRRFRGNAERSTGDPAWPGGLLQVRLDGARLAVGPRRIPRTGLQRRVPAPSRRDLHRSGCPGSDRWTRHQSGPRRCGRGDRAYFAFAQAESLRPRHRYADLFSMRGGLAQNPEAGMDRLLQWRQRGAGAPDRLHQGARANSTI